VVGGLGGDERGGMSTGEAVARYFWMQRFVVSFILPSVRFLIHLTFVRSISMTSIELVRPGAGRVVLPLRRMWSSCFHRHRR